PVLPAEPSAQVRAKKANRTSVSGHPVHSFATLLHVLAAKSRVTSRITTATDEVLVTHDTIPSPLQREALRLIQALP
ncbi:MAG: IS1634 family transposase, partial [Thermoanaerobaculia bacterium]